MKTLLRLSILALLLGSGSAMAQAKIGIVDFDSLITLMPKFDSLQKVSAAYQEQLKNEYTLMLAEYDKKVKEYQAKDSTWTDMIKKMKQEDIVKLETNIRDFQQNADLEMQRKNAELLKPLQVSAQKAIEAVAKEGKYTMVLDKGMGNILYSTPTDNIMPLVKKKLGIIK